MFRVLETRQDCSNTDKQQPDFVCTDFAQKGLCLDIGPFRPISKPSFISKILEKM